MGTRSVRALALFLLAASYLFGQSVAVRTQELPWAIIGSGYHELLQAEPDGRCPQSDLAITVTSGRLPRGLEIRGQFLTGTAKERGDFKFVLKATNSCSSTQKQFELVVSEKPILKVSPTTLAFERRVGQAGNPPAQTVRVSGTWAELPYSADHDAEWVVAKRGGLTPPNDFALSSDSFPVEVTGKQLTPGVYRSIIRFSVFGGVNAPEVVVKLTVLP